MADIEKLIKKQQEMLDKEGWYAHMVSGDTSCPLEFNYHTHGLPESFQHPDFQICLPVPPKIAHNVTSALVKHIKAGKKYLAGGNYRGILGDYAITFKEVEESGRRVLRIIFPDKTGCLDKDEMEEPFGEQYNCDLILMGNRFIIRPNV